MEKEKRINTNDHFESCYLRHQYLKQIKYCPTREEIELYRPIIENFGKNTFFVYKDLFDLVGLDLEDVRGITEVYLLSFLGAFALERNPNKLEDFKKLFKDKNFINCTKEDILNKNKANFTCFLKQRLQDLVRVCRQKGRNIKGLVIEKFLVFSGKKRPPLNLEDLIENYEAYKYKPVSIDMFKAILRDLKGQEGPVYTVGKTWYACVPIRKKNLSLNDFIVNNVDPTQNIYNLNPEEYAYVAYIENSCEQFRKSTKKRKVEVVKEFLTKNKKDPTLKEELKTARKFLKNVGV